MDRINNAWLTLTQTYYDAVDDDREDYDEDHEDHDDDHNEDDDDHGKADDLSLYWFILWVENTCFAASNIFLANILWDLKFGWRLA